MKHSIKTVLLALFIGLCSCKSSTKNQNKDTIVDIKKSSTKWYPVKPTQEEIDASKQDDSLRKPGDTKAIFTGFAVVLHDFNVYNGFDENGKLLYEVDSSEVTVSNPVNRRVTLTLKNQDTLHLTNGIFNSFYKNLIEVIPENKNDQFKIDFSYQITVYQLDDTSRTSKDGKNLIGWYGMTNYTSMPDSSGYFFRMPQIAYNGYFSRNDIKKKISVKDTSIIYNGESFEEAQIIYKNKPCGIHEDATYIRIQRFIQGVLKATKFIRIDLPDTD